MMNISSKYSKKHFSQSQYHLNHNNKETFADFHHSCIGLDSHPFIHTTYILFTCIIQVRLYKPSTHTYSRTSETFQFLSTKRFSNTTRCTLNPTQFLYKYTAYMFRRTKSTEKISKAAIFSVRYRVSISVLLTKIRDGITNT